MSSNDARVAGLKKAAETLIWLSDSFAELGEIEAAEGVISEAVAVAETFRLECNQKEQRKKARIARQSGEGRE